MRPLRRLTTYGILLVPIAFLTGCDHPAPPPTVPVAQQASATAATSALPEPSASAAFLAPAPPAPTMIPLAALEPDPDEPATYPSGVISQALLDSLSPADDVRSSPLANGAACASAIHADPSKLLDGCGVQIPSLLAFDAKSERVAFLDIDPTDARDGCQMIKSEVAPLGQGAETVRSLGLTSSEFCSSGPFAPWGPAEEMARLAKEGFSDATPLVKKTATAIFGAWGYNPVAVLRAPLRGFLLRVTMIGGKADAAVDLVAPDNKTVRPLHRTNEHQPLCKEKNAQGACRPTSADLLPSVVAASLSPDQKRLAVLVKLNTPAGHDTAEYYVREAFDVPKGVLAPQAKTTP